MLTYLLLSLLGAAVGVFGTLIGAGGGFILVPTLLLLYPHESAETITSISLAVTFANAFSGSAAYARMGRVHYRYGLIFAAVSVPGAILGSLVTAYVQRRAFDAIFGVALLAAAVVVFVKAPADRGHALDGPVVLSRRGLAAGILISIAISVLSTFLGIGGGIIHVPALVGLLDFPVHVATATSHFILAIVAGTGTVTHVASGAFAHGARRAVALAVGVLLGAQLGARLSSRVKGRTIIRALAVALALVGVRLLLHAHQAH